MPFPPHFLLQYGGDFVSEPGEIWSNTIRFALGESTSETPAPIMSGAEQQAAAAGMFGILSAHMTTAGSQFGSNVRLKYAKLNAIAPSGLYADQTSSHGFFAPGDGTPGTSSSNFPVTTAMVITWLTDANRGPASKGRIFVPQPTGSVSAPSYRFATAAITTTAGVYKDLLDDLTVAISTAGADLGVKAAVVSQLGAGLARHIDRVQVGNFPDYMGSRRNNLQESRVQSAPLT